jgi:hypothetical protein
MGGSWPQEVCLAAQALGVVCTPEQARRHFHYHRVEQPALSGSLRREALLYEARLLSPRAQAILRAAYRHRVLDTEQICEIFYRSSTHGAYGTARSALSKCQAELSRLCARHFLYRLYPEERMSTKYDALPQMGKRTLWFLGKASVPFIEEEHPGTSLWPDHYVQMAKEISHVKIMHDLRANGVYVRLHRALREAEGTVDLAGRPTAVELRDENWYGDKSLGLAFYDAALRLSDEVRADGFASISAHRNAWEGARASRHAREEGQDGVGRGLPSCQMPFFYEYDRGTKHTRDVAAQLLAFHRLAVSGRAGDRFPDLKAEGYAIPVIMVCGSEAQVRNIHRSFRREAEREGISGGSPIFLASEREWLEDPLADGVCRSAWADPKAPGGRFLDALLEASQPLVESRQVLASQALAIRPLEARRVVGVATEEGLAAQRERKDALRERRGREERGQAKPPAQPAPGKKAPAPKPARQQPTPEPAKPQVVARGPKAPPAPPRDTQERSSPTVSPPMPPAGTESDGMSEAQAAALRRRRRRQAT